MKHVLACLVLMAGALAGCASDSPDGATPPMRRVTLAEELEGAEFDTTGPYAKLRAPGPYDVLPMERVAFPSSDGTQLEGALWRPDVPAGMRVPVVLMISPYFSTGLFDADTQTQEFYLDQIGRHGYAFAKVAVRGTSYSHGCMQSMGPVEQQDMDSIVTWFGEADWSSGAVAIMGVSYVGTTPWAAAMHGNPYLKTIVPISGVTDWFELGFRNGTREPRTPIHMQLYWGQYGVADQVLTSTVGPADGDETVLGLAENVCEEAVWSNLVGPASVALQGDSGAARVHEYWMSRNLQPAVRDNYEGSIYLVHGIRDWNVNIDMSVPFVTRLQAAGTEVKWMLGQWGHARPDQVSRGEHVRFDFAELILRWFDVHLKGMDLDTGAAVDVEDNLGLWRTEDTWPPGDAAWTTWHLGAGTLDRNETTAGSSPAVNPGGLVDPQECAEAGLPLPDMIPGTEWRFSMGTLGEELRFAGAPRVHVTVSPADPLGGVLYAELLIIAPDGTAYRAAHGGMNLRYHTGTHEAQTIVPGQPVLARMEMYPADVVVPAGHGLLLRLVPDANIEPCAALVGEDIIQRPKIPQPAAIPLTVHWGPDSTLSLPVIGRDVGDGRYPGQPA